MAEYETIGARGVSGSRAAQIDEGLRSYMNKVYGLMSGALLVTFALAYLVASSPALQSIFLVSPIVWIVIFGPLAFVMVMSFGLHKLSVPALNGLFWAYAALTGVSLSTIFLMFNMMDVIMGLLLTSVGFLGLTLTGYLTKRDLGPVGQIAGMMVWGLLAWGIFGMFFGMGEGAFQIYNIAILGVFAALTAWSTQEIKNNYLAARMQGGPEAEMYLEKGAILGALNLYISFIAMFRSIMYLFMGGDD